MQPHLHFSPTMAMVRLAFVVAAFMSCQCLFAAAPTSRQTPKPAAKKGAEAESGPSEQAWKHLAELEKFDPLDPRRADVVEKLAQQARTAADRAMWYQQMADTLAAAAQSGNAPDAMRKLDSLYAMLRQSKSDAALAAYVRFRAITVQHAHSLQSPAADYAKIQATFTNTLEQFVADHPAAAEAGEAMLQLGIARELEGRESDAKRWYARVTRDAAGTPAAAKAQGAIVRLDSVGRTVAISGKSIAGPTLQLADYRGKVVLIHYWATWSEPCKRDLATLKQLAGKYGPELVVLGISLDNDEKVVSAMVADRTLSWPQIHERGGMDSPPANQLGILTVPTMLLVDQDGKVVSRAIQAADVEPQVKRLLR